MPGWVWILIVVLAIPVLLGGGCVVCVGVMSMRSSSSSHAAPMTTIGPTTPTKTNVAASAKPWVDDLAKLTEDPHRRKPTKTEKRARTKWSGGVVPSSVTYTYKLPPLDDVSLEVVDETSTRWEITISSRLQLGLALSGEEISIDDLGATTLICTHRSGAGIPIVTTKSYRIDAGPLRGAYASINDGDIVITSADEMDAEMRRMATETGTPVPSSIEADIRRSGCEE